MALLAIEAMFNSFKCKVACQTHFDGLNLACLFSLLLIAFARTTVQHAVMCIKR